MGAWERGTGGLILYAAPGRYPSGQRGQAVNLLRKLRWFESNPAHSRFAASAARPSGGRRHAPELGTASAAGLQHPLHLDDVEPLAELPAHLAFGADDDEPARPVQRDRRVVLPGDAGDHRMEAVGLGQPQQFVEQLAPDACAAGVRDGGRPSPRPWWRTRGGPGRWRANRTPRSRRRPRRRGRDGRRSARRSTAPARRACGAPCRRGRSTRRRSGCRWRGCPRRPAARRPDPKPFTFMVDSASPSRPSGRLRCISTASSTARQGSAGVGVAILFGSAPLAQSAEHFHGKEGVYGSSP